MRYILESMFLIKPTVKLIDLINYPLHLNIVTDDFQISFITTKNLI
jgi:hypothetical protein